MLSAISYASDTWLREAYASATSQERAEAKVFELTIKQTLVHLVGSKLAFWSHLPWKLLGCFGHGPDVTALPQAQAVARACIDEYEQARIDGHASSVHRVAHFLLDRGSGFRAQLHAFVVGTLPLDSFPSSH